MQDGIRLYTRILLPSKQGQFPLVFIRTPYEAAREGQPYSPEGDRNNAFLQNGYGVVTQHIRGCGDSEGICVPYCERNDGLDTLAILRTKPYYNGEIYLTGASYLATAHLCYLDTNPPDVKAVALQVQQDRMFTYQHHNGCCRSFCGFTWYMSMIRKTHPPIRPAEEVIYRPYAQLVQRTLGKDFKPFTDTLLSNTYNDFWQTRDDDHAVDNLTIPILLTGGWFDFYTEGMLSMWERLPAATKQRSALIMGPYGHATRVQQAAYPLPHGDIPEDTVLQFFNSVRDNTTYPYHTLGHVHYYSVGGDFWTTDIHEQQDRCLYFSADGNLVASDPTPGEKAYRFDPDTPLNYYKHLNIHRAPLANSVDGVVSFLSEAAEETMDFYGAIRWHMTVRSDCEDTAFFMRVYLVEGDEAYNLADAITTISHNEKDYVPGQVCHLTADTTPIAFTLKKGHRLRVDISSHSDLYVPHANTREHWALAETAKIAMNTLVYGTDSYIILPRSL